MALSLDTQKIKLGLTFNVNLANKKKYASGIGHILINILFDCNLVEIELYLKQQILNF